MPGTENFNMCAICNELKNDEYSFSKYGWEDGTTILPAEAEKLVTVKDLKPGSERAKLLKQCPECGTFYLYTTDYEYLTKGTEDEEFLHRLTAEETEEYINPE